MSEFSGSFKRGRTNLKREDEMKTIGMVALFAILVLQNVCLSQNIIQNGGFENDFSGWVPVDSGNISTAVVVPEQSLLWRRTQRKIALV